jgi:hypothetical protein
VTQHGNHGARDLVFQTPLHEALKAGPLKSEAQGLDLSADIAGGGFFDTVEGR